MCGPGNLGTGLEGRNMVGFLESSDLLIAEVLGAIVHFIERQKLVVQAMKDLDIDLEDVGKSGTAIWSQQGSQKPLPPLPASASGEAKELWAAVKRARSRRPVAQQGVWGDSGEWTYFLHGKGCRLRNTLTGEVIDWDCPDVKAFDPYSLVDHLRWRLETEHENSLPSIRKWVSHSPDGLDSIVQLLIQMVEGGLVNPDWTLPRSAAMENTGKPMDSP
jgi:hypothetical protein